MPAAQQHSINQVGRPIMWALATVSYKLHHRRPQQLTSTPIDACSKAAVADQLHEVSAGSSQLQAALSCMLLRTQRRNMPGYLTLTGELTAYRQEDSPKGATNCQLVHINKHALLRAPAPNVSR
jgi:hypothetical protein